MPHLLIRKMLLTLLCLLALSVPAAQTLADADWFEREIADGVTWRFYLFDDLFDSIQSISYIEADLSNPNVSVEIPYLVSGRQRVSSMIPEQFPDAVGGLNATYFNTSVGGHVTYLRVDGEVIPGAGPPWADWSNGGALAKDAEGDASIVFMPAGGWVNNTENPDIIACGPPLIVDGVIPSADLVAIGGHSTFHHPRSAVGTTADNRLILITVDGRTELSSGMSCQELAETMQQLGCTDAVNMDGGGSTTLWGAGEPFNGVLNYPSDNGEYDHGGERSCSNAIAIISTPATPAQWDARLLSKTVTSPIPTGGEGTITLTYENAGSGTWQAAELHLLLARPLGRTSELQHGDWISDAEPVAMSPATVGPGETATFTFPVSAPLVAVSTNYDEHFVLTRDGVGRVGPADSEAWLRVSVQPPIAAGETFIVESRPGGQNYPWYTDDGMANTSVNCTAPGTTDGIGSRYGSTYQSVAGLKNATVTPDFPAAGDYAVHVAYAAGSSRRSPVTYHVNHANGSETFQLDQTVGANTWIQLGSGPYHFEEGMVGTVVMTNEDIDVSGSMYASAVKFEYLGPELQQRTHVVPHVGVTAPIPNINGDAYPGEWTADTHPASGFVVHDDPEISAAEQCDVSMVYTESDLYILFEMENAYMGGYAAPPSPTTFESLIGDRFNVFLTPGGVDAEPFYRLVFSPNPATHQCHVWTQANATKTLQPSVGTDWQPSMQVAMGLDDAHMVIECRIPWSEFDHPGMAISGGPQNGDVWGMQLAISNELSDGVWEYVNWEPDRTPTFINGTPFGGLEFLSADLAASGSSTH